jgi:hypothetical protein
VPCHCQRHSLGARILISSMVTKYFLSYRASGGTGTDTYILLGDPHPNSDRFAQRLSTKFVWPLAF